MGSVNSTTTTAGDFQPSQVTADPVKGFKKWHRSVQQKLRNHLVQKLALTIFQITDLQSIHNLEVCARQYECDAYKTAESPKEYLHKLLVQKIKTIQQEVMDKQSLTRSGAALSASQSTPHCSLTMLAFSLCLSVALYAEAVQKDPTRSQMIQLLVLGVTSDEAGKILICPDMEQALFRTFPYELLQQLLKEHPGVFIRQQVLDFDIVQLLLSCLAVFTKQVSSTIVAIPSKFYIYNCGSLSIFANLSSLFSSFCPALNFQFILCIGNSKETATKSGAKDGEKSATAATSSQNC